jgi:hypothetical protein
MTATVHDLAERVFDARQKSWDRADQQTAIVATETLGPEDERVVRRVVGEAGYTGTEFEEMVRQVSNRVVGKVEALADHQPADGAD